MRLYTDLEHYEPAFYGSLCELLKPFLREPVEGLEARVARHGPFLQHYSLVSEPSKAEAMVLPLSWNHYARTGRMDQALAFVARVRSLGKPILTSTTGDFGITPPVEDVHVFRTSGYASRRRDKQHALPFFLTDPLQRFFDRDQPFQRPRQERPVVGFCGQALGGLGKQGLDLGRILLRNARYHLRLGLEDPQSAYPSIRLRQRVLRIVEGDPRLCANFIRRRRYRGGARTDEEQRRTTREYYDNIAESDYIVCVRGSGNFSTRLYETLAMGRIPVFVNTDCILPCDEVLDWHEFVVWVEVEEVARLPEILLRFHEAHDEQALHAAQQRCRELWVERLSLNGYFSHLPELLA